MILKFHNEYHQGDCIYHVQFCNLILDRCPEVDSIVNYFHPQYIKQANDFIIDKYSDKIHNIPIDDSVDCKNSINCWINRNNTFSNWVANPPNYFDSLYADVYNQIMKELGLPETFVNEDVLFTKSSEIKEPLFDILLVNSIPNSGQWNYNGADFDKFIFTCKENNLSVITTAKSRTHMDIPTTQSEGYDTLMDIQILSSRCRNIIGIHTAPFIVSVNYNSVNNADNIIAFQNQGLLYDVSNYKVIAHNFNDVYNILGV